MRTEFRPPRRGGGGIIMPGGNVKKKTAAEIASERAAKLKAGPLLHARCLRDHRRVSHERANQPPRMSCR